MRIKFVALLILAMFWICFSSGAHAADMATEYLQGNWVIGTTEQKCGDPESEYFTFRNNGSFEAGRSGRAEAVGFWQVDGETVYLVYISSGGFFQNIHTDLKEF